MTWDVLRTGLMLPAVNKVSIEQVGVLLQGHSIQGENVEQIIE